jgi:hypothetical protein
MDLEVDVNSHQASPFADIYQAEVIFPRNFNTVKSVVEVDCAFSKTLKSSLDTVCMVLMRQVQ